MDREERLESHRFSSNSNLRKSFFSFTGRKPVIYWIINMMAYFALPPFRSKLYRLNGISIGKGTLISQTMGLDYVTPENIEIGDNCVIGHSATILGHEMTADRIKTGKVEIGDRVTVGANSTILPGVKIGDDAVVAAGAVVTGVVESGQKVAGVPARPIDKTE